MSCTKSGGEYLDWLNSLTPEELEESAKREDMMEAAGQAEQKRLSEKKYATQEEKLDGWRDIGTVEELNEWTNSLTPEEREESDRRYRAATGQKLVPANQVANDMKARYWFQGLFGFGVFSLLVWGFTYLLFGPNSFVALLDGLERHSTIDDTVNSFISFMALLGPLYWLHFTSCYMMNCASLVPERVKTSAHPTLMLIFAAFMLFLTCKTASITNERLLNGEMRETVARAAQLEMNLTMDDIRSERSNNGAFWFFMVAATLVILGGLAGSMMASDTRPLITSSVYVFVCAAFIPTMVGLAAPLLVVPFILLGGYFGMNAVSKMIVAKL